MRSLFIKSLIRHTKNAKSASILLLVGLYIAVLCMSMMLGYAMGRYEIVAGRSEYATLTIDPGTDIVEDIDSFISELDHLYGHSISNILLLSTYSEDTVLIGWKGTEGRRWFPFTMGRFFTDDEQSNGENVAFVSDSYIQSGNSSTSVLVNNKEHLIIGTGWIANYNIESAISQNTAYNLFGSSQESKYFIIIPWKSYVKENHADLICIHFDYASNADLKEYQHYLSGIYPDSSIYLPNYNSDDELVSENMLGIVRSLIMAFIACVTILQLMSQWIEFYRKELTVYHIVGMSRIKCSFLLWGHWTVFFTVGSSLAIATHFASLSLLDIVKANYMPAVLPLLFVLGVIYITTILYSSKHLLRVLKIKGGGEAI